MPKTKINLDELWAEEHADRVDEEIQYVTVTAFGEEFRVSKSQNIASLFFAMDPDDKEATKYFIRAFINTVHPDEQRNFKAAVARQESFSGEDLAWYLGKLVEVAGEGNPSAKTSGASRGSGRTSTRSTAKALSAGS